MESALSSFRAEETLSPLQLLCAKYFVIATVTKLEQYAVDNIGQAHLQGWATEILVIKHGMNGYRGKEYSGWILAWLLDPPQGSLEYIPNF